MPGTWGVCMCVVFSYVRVGSRYMVVAAALLARPGRVLQRLEPAGGTQALAASATRSIRKLEDPMWTLLRETAAGSVVRRSAIRAGALRAAGSLPGSPN